MANIEKEIEKATEEMQAAFAVYFEKYLALKELLDQVSDDDLEEEEEPEEEEESLIDLEESEYWKNVLDDELKRWNR